MVAGIFAAIACFFAVYAWILKRKYVTQLNIANDEARIRRIAFDNTALGMTIVDTNFKYVCINKSYGDIVGYTTEELFSMIHKDFIHPEDRELDTPFVKEIYEGNIDSFRSVKRYIHKKGHLVWAEATVSVVRDEKGAPKLFVTQIQDITLAKKAEEKLKQSRDQAEILARTDYLTGVLNRRAFIIKLQEELERTKRNMEQTAMILVDIDLFKTVNDRFGHLAGDYVLQEFAESLKRNIRTNDFIGRFGGEEFIICLTDTDPEKAYIIAERMRKNVEELDLNYQGSKINITGSFGIAHYDYDSSESMNQLISKADKAMYLAKNHKNSVYQWAS
jgi:diguanylate cyclase (GGDEF)-like protein/PAS domain S-box-containing protein